MADAFNFELVSPEQLLLSAQVTQVVVPGSAGYLTVMANHSPLMTTLNPGVVEVTKTEGGADRFVVFGGFIDVTPDGCTLLAESAVHVDALNADELDKRIQDAKEDINDASGDDAVQKAQMYLDQLTTLRGAILPA